MTKYEKIVEEIKQEFPNFLVVQKESSKLMKFIYFISFMFLWNPRFIEDYTTVMFGKVYMPDRFIGSNSAYQVLRHERVHLRDMRDYKFLFEISYLLLFPTIITMRAFWEYRAYCESLRAYQEIYGKINKKMLDSILEQFAGASYFFMFPFRNYLKNKFLTFMKNEGITYEE